MRRALLILLCCLAAGAAGRQAAAAQPLLTLEQAIALALARNPALAASQQDVAVAESQLTQARAGYLPQLSYQAGYDRGWSEGLRRSQGAGYTQGQYNSYASDLSLSQYLYDFGQTRGKVDKGRHALSASQQNLRKSLADVVLGVSQAFYEVLKQKDLTQVQEEALRAQENHLAQARAFLRAGAKPKLDVTKAEVQLANTNLALIQARYAWRNAVVSLEQLMAGPPAEGGYELAPAPPPAQAPPEPEGLIALALERRPEVQSYKEQIKAAQAGLMATEAAHWPTISAEGSWGWDSTGLPLQESWLVGATLNLPLFTGFKTQGQIGEARAGLAKLTAQLKQQELAVTQEVTAAALAVRQALETVAAARQALRQAEENMALAEGRWRVGVGNAIEYADARLTLTQAQGTLVQAMYGYWQAAAGLDHALGRGGPA